jgi:transposase
MVKRQAMMDKIQARIDQTTAELERLKAKSAEKQADARLALEKEIDKLEQKRDEAGKRWVALQESSGSAWQDFAEGAEEAWDALSDAVSKASKRFN